MNLSSYLNGIATYGVNYERLVALKNTYDPSNFFHLNQNIKPTVTEHVTTPLRRHEESARRPIAT